MYAQVGLLVHVLSILNFDGFHTTDNLFPRPIVNLVGGLFWIISDSNVSFDGQSIFSPGFVKYDSIVAKDWYLFTCCFYTYHVIKKDISFCFFFFFLSLK